MENELKKDIGEEILAKLRVLEIIMRTKLRGIENEEELPAAFISRIRPA
jgi:hypothetical protein